MLTISELKKALVEVHDFYATRDVCDGCPFGEEDAHRHLCYLSPFLYSATIPANWEVESLRKCEVEPE